MEHFPKANTIRMEIKNFIFELSICIFFKFEILALNVDTKPESATSSLPLLSPIAKSVVLPMH